jgi:hypothetical protein
MAAGLSSGSAFTRLRPPYPLEFCALVMHFTVGPGLGPAWSRRLLELEPRRLAVSVDDVDAPGVGERVDDVESSSAVCWLAALGQDAAGVGDLDVEDGADEPGAEFKSAPAYTTALVTSSLTSSVAAEMSSGRSRSTR